MCDESPCFQELISARRIPVFLKGIKRMSRYFFDLHNGDGATRDEQGQELASRASVKKEVNRILLDIVQEEIAERKTGVVSVVVRDDNGRAVSVANLTFSNAWLDEVTTE
jgi:hypothetical protein